MAIDSPVTVRRLAMDMLAQREHGRTELARKLLRKGAPKEWVDEVLERLAQQGLLSEERYLESYVRSRTNAGYGPLRIRQELLQCGLSGDQIKAALQAENAWDALLEQVWRRKFKGVVPQDSRELARQARFLSYRGFSPEQISRLLHGESFL